MKTEISRNSNSSSGTTQTLFLMDSTPFHSWGIKNDEAENRFFYTLANDFDTRKKAYSVANGAFQELGYLASGSEYVVGPHDCDEDTFTLLVKNDEGEDIATVSLYFDKYNVLPGDEVFNDEIKSLRNDNVRIAEVTRLAIVPRYRHSKVLISRMFNMMYLYAYRMMKYTDLVIEVKEAHAHYYEKILSFNVLGNPRPCLRVNGTMANILHIKLEDIHQLILGCRDHVLEKKSKRSIYNLVVSHEQEYEVLEYFKKNKRSMSKREMAFYGICIEDISYFNNEVEFA